MPARQIASALFELEGILREMGLWEDTPPAEEALQSVQPFCVDTLDFHQWLQWVFIPGIMMICTQELVFPETCNIAPMAEEWLKFESFDGSDLLETLNMLDALITRA